MGQIPKVEILNIKLTPVTYHFLLNSIFTSEDKGFATLNSVHGIIESKNSQLIKNSINNSTFALCDGRPLYWALKNKFKDKFDHITGRVLMHKICQRAEKENSRSLTLAELRSLTLRGQEIPGNIVTSEEPQ